MNPNAFLPRRLLTWLALIAVGSMGGTALAKVTATRGQIELPTYPWWPAVKHPYFQATDGRHIYPYPMLDNLSRTQTKRTYATVVLENEYLRITFLPELGGKIHEVIDKTTSQLMFYVNHVVKPGLIGQCGAWTSGGVEWNTGPQGHTVGCMQPVEVEILPPDKDGARSVAIGETERIYRTRWSVVVTLRPGRALIEERIRIYNPNLAVRPYYFWNCTAMPNTPGFQFVYPMTLGCDHGAEKFFQWPIDQGKDLSRGTNYQDASSIFAWHCDQDFFGSYDHGVNRGVVSYADHRQLPGKKAWTWGQGGFGQLHQRDLTDADGPYNEVQTGPLLTQAEVGRLDPYAAVSWQEWWYPIHGIGGFTFANRDVAINATTNQHGLELQIAATARWSPVRVTVHHGPTLLASGRCRVAPDRPARVSLAVGAARPPYTVRLEAEGAALAEFRFPLDLPVRHRPEKRVRPEAPGELVADGWQKFLFAQYSEAEKRFRDALEKEQRLPEARAGLALINLDRYPLAAMAEARAALSANPEGSLARLILAGAHARTGEEAAALDEAAHAALQPGGAVAGRALLAGLWARRADWPAATAALAGSGPWQTDPTCRDLLALAWLKRGEAKEAVRLAQGTLELDPLDAFARSVLWLAHAEPKSVRLEQLVEGKAQSVLDLAAAYSELGQEDVALAILDRFYLKPVPARAREPIPCYWAAWLSSRQDQPERAEELRALAKSLPCDGVFPHRRETEPVLRWALKVDPADGHAALYLGHLLFALGRHAEGRDLWAEAARDRSTAPVALRALGMAAAKLDGQLTNALESLRLAHKLDPADPIIARDLARTWFDLAGKTDDAARKNGGFEQARDTLRAAFASGKGRSDFVALLARAHNHLGEHAETARMLDTVRVTVWEGARELHDLFEDAHLAVGEAHLKAGRPAEALAEFNRALEYPENLATGKLENPREAHIQYLRGKALAALGRKTEAMQAWTAAASEPESKDSRHQRAQAQARDAMKNSQ